MALLIPDWVEQMRGRGRTVELTGRSVALGLLVLSLAACAPTNDRPEEEGTTRPGLIVLIVVDQLGSELLAARAGALDGGLSRLIEGGAYVPAADVGYALTNSAPGHVTAATGALPNRHGVVDNGWMERSADGAWRYVSAVSDPGHSLVGTPGSSDGASPHRRLVPAIGDWARLSDARSRAVSIGQGPTSANSMAAHSGGMAFWYSAEANGFISSTYYMDALPGWVVAFNQDILPALQVDSVWTPSVPGDHGAQTSPVHEFRGDSADGPSYGSWYQQTPFMDEAILQLAREAIKHLVLGGRGPVDVLTINLSSLDEAGHTYGARSIERLDALHQVDRAVGRLMDFLDDAVGPGAWALALTGDHGVAPSPEQPDRAAIGAERVSLGRLRQTFLELEQHLAAVSESRKREVAAGFLEERSFVRRVYTIDELAAASPADRGFLSDYARSSYPGRILDWPIYDLRGDLSPASLGLAAIQMTEGSVVDFAVGVHGSPYEYDRRVPMMFWLPGRPSEGMGWDAAGVGLADLAPTLAGFAGLAPASEVDGRDLVAQGRQP
jgi:hypothetical protein